MSRELKLLSVVAPMYNEEATAAAFCERVVRRAGGPSARARSSSTTGRATARARSLDDLAARDPASGWSRLSRNFGHQTAITAGLDHARGDAVVMIDADLQDPPEVIPTMLGQLARGRRRRLRRAPTSARARRASSWRPRTCFYRADVARVAQSTLAPDSGDFRLMDRRALDALLAHARAQPLPARHDRVGRLHADRRALQARRALRAARRSSRCGGCCASRSTRSPRSRTCRCRWRRVLGFVFSLSRSWPSRS